MDERLRFVARLLEGEKMAVLCREFEISTRTYNQRINQDVTHQVPHAAPHSTISHGP
jgi:hypothetical protein